MAGFTGLPASVSRALSWPLRWREAPGNTQTQDASSSPAATRGTDSSFGVKITTIRRNDWPEWSSNDREDSDVFYIQGNLKRWERPRSYTGQTNPDGSTARKYGPHIVTIIRADLGKMFELNLDASEYTEAPYPPTKPKPLTKGQMDQLGMAAPQKASDSNKTTFRIVTTTKDTGERKKMFGYLARHVITTRQEIPLEGSQRSEQETVTDAWYIDLEPGFYPTIYPQNYWGSSSGPRGRRHAYTTARSPKSPAAPEIPEFVDIGDAETGFPVEEMQSSENSFALPDGTTRKSESKSEKTVTIEKTVFDRALFDIPRGFRRVSRIQPNPI